MSDPNCLEGRGRTPEQMAADYRALQAVAPTAADKLALMFRHLRPTPEVDANLVDISGAGATVHTRYVRADLARRLERQRDELLDFLSKLDAMACDDEYGSSDFRKTCRYDIPKAIAAVKGATT
jgi:hypothetical protein